MWGFGLRYGAVVSANQWSEMRCTSLCFEIPSCLSSEHRPQIHDDEIELGSAGSACAASKKGSELSMALNARDSKMS